MSVPPSKVSIVNLGCARNLVDAQDILGRLRAKGLSVASGREAEIVIINTCCFVEEARQESIDVILDVLELKKAGRIKKVILAGCLAQRYGRKLLDELKDIDALTGVPLYPPDRPFASMLLTPPHYAYVKICEGCFNNCSYCVIPAVKGPLASRTKESVLSEIRELDAQGIKEINLIGQDITAYGLDIYGRPALVPLLKEILRSTRSVCWVRLLYLFPTRITDDLLELMAQDERICNYIDLPLQHISPKVLKAMNRKMTPAAVRALITNIRKKVPGVFLRTSLIVGFPGETEGEFNALLDFIREVRFERLGVFMYSREEGTPAFGMKPQIPGSLKKKRYDLLMSEQQKISRQIQERRIGQTLKVLIDEKPKEQENIYLGRTEGDAPEVDGQVFVCSSRQLRPGDFTEVLITDSSEYDLSGTAQ